MILSLRAILHIKLGNEKLLNYLYLGIVFRKTLTILTPKFQFFISYFCLSKHFEKILLYRKLIQIWYLIPNNF